jgi:ADP-heptose:LPS heptosyltransferase
MASVGYFEILDSVTPFLHRSKVMGFGIRLKREEMYERENISYRAMKICSALDMPWKEKIFFNLSSTVREKVRIHLGITHASAEKPLVVIHPFAGWKFREWPLSNYMTIAKRMIENQSADVIMIGMQNEIERIGKDHTIPPDVKIFDAEHIPELLALFGRTALYIGNDSGPLHLASMAGVPCIGLFGPASPELTAPISERNVYLYHRVECSPCDQLRCLHTENPCINLILVNEVLDAASKFLIIPVNAP